MLTLEGHVSVLAAVQARKRRIQLVLVRRNAASENVAQVLAVCTDLGVPVREAERDEMDRMAHGVTHGGVLAVVGPVPRLDASQLCSLIDLTPNPLLLMLEGVEDARNLGFVLRTAEACGVAAVIVKKHLWDLDEADIARAASGALDRLPVAQIDDAAALAELAKRVPLIGCVPGRRRSIFTTDLTAGVCICLGGEKRGLSRAVRDACAMQVEIPTSGGASSLSLSHAAAILCGESLRQRKIADARGD